MNEFVYQKTSKSDLLFNKDVKLEPETLEEGSKDLYDIMLNTGGRGSGQPGMGGVGAGKDTPPSGHPNTFLASHAWAERAGNSSEGMVYVLA